MSAYGLSLVIDSENAAFADGNQTMECARILRVAAERLEKENPDYQLHVTLFDVNGNNVGELNYKPHWHATRQSRATIAAPWRQGAAVAAL